MSTAKALAFETSYRHYPFAPLVELGLAVAGLLKRTAAGGGKSGKPARDAGDAGGAVGHAA
ncbi:MAG: hypothetical protein IIB62_02515 [Proteobacteria bacterium]|nr:hypothetical protein [Pseudomonadota bacterium]